MFQTWLHYRLFLQLQRIRSLEHAGFGFFVVEIARRRIDGLARILDDLGHFPLQHADIISARTAVHLAKSGPFPEHVKIARSAIEFVGIRRTEQPVVTRAAVYDIGTACAKQRVIAGTAAEDVIFRVAVDGIVARTGDDDIFAVAPQYQVMAGRSDASCLRAVTGRNLAQVWRKIGTLDNSMGSLVVGKCLFGDFGACGLCGHYRARSDYGQGDQNKT